MKTALGTIAVLLTFMPGARGQGMTDEQATKVAQDMARQHEAWRSQLSSPGTSIQAKVFGRDGAVVNYRLYVSGLPADTLYKVMSWPIDEDKPSVAMEGVSLGQDGMVMCTGRQAGECKREMGDELGALDFGFRSMKGMPFRVLVGNSKLRVAAVIIPDPITASEKGCSLNVERLTPNFELANLTGSGYAPGAQVPYSSESYGERLTGTTTADAAGRIHFIILPGVAGHTGGTTTVIATGAACTPTINFQWGRT